MTKAQCAEAAAARQVANTDAVRAPVAGLQRSPAYEAVYTAWLSRHMNAKQAAAEDRARAVERRWLHWFLDAWGRGARTPDAMLAVLSRK